MNSFNFTYPLAMRVFSDLVMILRSGRTPVAQAASCQAKKSINSILVCFFNVTYRFRGTFYFYEAHAAITSHTEAFMIAETRNLDASFLAGLENGVSTVNLNTR